MLVVHQLMVKVAGWLPITIPISVDKIGVFFREIWPTNDSDLDSAPELPPNRDPVRLVFAISLSDTQKVVNVRSALVIVNKMELPLDVRLDSNKDDQSKDSNQTTLLPTLPVKGYTAVPLHLTSQSIRVRPHGWAVEHCNRQLAWRHALGKQPTSHTRECVGPGAPFKFCVSVQRENYPLDVSPQQPYPAHTITLYPPLTLANLLPCDLQFSLVGDGVKTVVRRGKEIAIYSVSFQ